MPHTPLDTRRRLIALAAILLLAPGLAAAAAPSCSAVLGTPRSIAGPLPTVGTQSASADLAVDPGHRYLLEVDERDNDVLVEILNSKQEVVAQSDHPEWRTGTRRALGTAEGSNLHVRISGQEHDNARGTVSLRAFDLSGTDEGSPCLEGLRALADADADYAAGREIFRGHVTSPKQTARDAYRRAAARYTEAQQTFAAAGIDPLAGQTRIALAQLEYYDLQDYEETVEWANQALPMLKDSDPFRAAFARGLRAAAWIELGKQPPPKGDATSRPPDFLRLALRELKRLQAFYAARNDRMDEALQIQNIGLVQYYVGQYRQAIASFGEANTLFDQLGERQHHAGALQMQALCYWGLGHMQQALTLSRLALAESPPDPPDQYVNLVNNTALAEYALGHFDESLRLYDLGLALADRIELPRQQGYALYGIGEDYYALGDAVRARQFLERSLLFRTPKVDGRGRMTTLRALATIDAEEGRLPEALRADQEALGLALSPPAIARIRIQLAVHTAAANHPEEAHRILDDVIQNPENNAAIRAEALLQRGVLREQMRELTAAQADLVAARSGLHRFGSVSEEFTADLELARILREEQEPAAALAGVERALRLADAVRLQSANPELRSQLQAPLRAGYDLKIELLRNRYELLQSHGQPSKAAQVAASAFLTADASRARTLADVAQENYSPGTRADLAGELRKREEIYHELAARRFALGSHLERAAANDSVTKRLLDEIAELQRRADVINTALATRTRGEELTPRGTTELPHLPPGTGLIAYWLGDTSAYAWVITPQAISWTRLGSSAAVAAAAAAFHDSLSRLADLPRERRLRDAGTLYDLVLAPLGPALADAKHWIVVPDGALDYVAFAALQGADGFVAAHHDVALTPAAWMLRNGAPTHAAKPATLLLVDDPVYERSDPRLGVIARTTGVDVDTTGAAASTSHPLRRLEFSREEAARVRDQFPPNAVEELSGLDATRDRFLALDLARFRYIHIATHGIVDAQIPQLSALILSTYDGGGRPIDGAVRVADLSLQRLSADVAVFSACETALGRHVPSEGLVGISSTVLARGAHAVVASLWPVSDEMSVRLMTEFYRHLLQDGESAPEALGAAMRTQLSREGSADPSLWGAFQVYIATLGSGLPPHAANPRAATRQGLGELP
jgi:CHAT domain-containing protein